MPPMMPPRPMMPPPNAPMGAPSMPPRPSGAPMPQQQPQQPLMDAGALQRQALIKMLGQAQAPSPDGSLPPQFTMPKPYAPPNPMNRGGRGGGGY